MCVGSGKNNLGLWWGGCVPPETLSILGSNKKPLGWELWMKFCSLMFLYLNWVSEPTKILYILCKKVWVRKNIQLLLAFQTSDKKLGI